jgi:hypothetical protein
LFCDFISLISRDKTCSCLFTTVNYNIPEILLISNNNMKSRNCCQVNQQKNRWEPRWSKLIDYCLSFSYFILFFYSTEVWTQTFTFARQATLPPEPGLKSTIFNNFMHTCEVIRYEEKLVQNSCFLIKNWIKKDFLRVSHQD